MRSCREAHFRGRSLEVWKFGREGGELAAAWDWKASPWRVESGEGLERDWRGMGKQAAVGRSWNPNPNPNWAQLQSKLRTCTSCTANDSVLGKRKRKRKDSCSDSDAVADLPSGLNPLSHDTSLTKVLAIDCEMVGVGFQATKSALARVTLVNSCGNVLYDQYVRPLEHISDYRTRISGIRPNHMIKAKDFWAVQQTVADLIKGHILVGHALHHDLKALLLSHPKSDTRDTSEYEPLRRGSKTRALKDLAAEILRVKIQQKEHCPVEDARAAMYIYNKHKKVWEKSLKDQVRRKNKLKDKKKKKKRIDADLKI
ncbi:RNA exonuclease 4 [Rhynchospora pubera]|uniref:RNA exonuclease 4 n=1 Tax=Rhynchospora pubera TaxID=906938 RepID=A0AAV8H211_9POAL|nr:RNA exonuclease 4 [Rhynchospora pubera]